MSDVIFVNSVSVLDEVIFKLLGKYELEMNSPIMGNGPQNRKEQQLAPLNSIIYSLIDLFFQGSCPLAFEDI